MTRPSRDMAVDITRAALLIIDVQNYCAHPEGGWWRHHEPAPHFFASLGETVVPNIGRLQDVCREAKIEIMYSVIENMTWDGRDRSFDYKVSDIDVLPASWDARVLGEIAPIKDESSSVRPQATSLFRLISIMSYATSAYAR
jgi:ureidoacrylate peracid hydrolase